ncbi:DUF3278 domain-containing protein [Streptococcus gallolyticus]|nr:DUF3278 domain-containing protein [Streptococcus gallolyticus]MBY5040207.1 DUF3278 domain-containing protein [Streptococcus gallolyticus]
MNKETFTEKMIKRFYGITGPLDEYKRREADRIGNVCFIYLSWLIIIGNVLAIFLGMRFPEVVAIAYPGFLMLGLFATFFYVMIKSDLTDIKKFDEEELTPVERKKMKHAGLKSGLFFGIFMYFYLSIQTAWSDNIAFFPLLLKPQFIIGGILGGLVFGASMSLIVRAYKGK